MGIQVSGTTAGMFYGSASVQQQDSSASLEDEDGKDVNSFFARGVFAPIVSETQVLHFGVDYALVVTATSAMAPSSTARLPLRLGVRGMSENATNVNTTNTPNNGQITLGSADALGFEDDSVVGLEFAYMQGPFSVQTEYLGRDLSGYGTNGDREATGYNAQLAYTLTGESRVYKLDGGKFDAIKPADKTMGAWEVFYRYDNLSVEDDNVMATVGGVAIDETEAKIHTIGTNWYVNEAVKLSLNYLMTQSNSDTVKLQNGRFALGDTDDDGKPSRCAPNTCSKNAVTVLLLLSPALCGAFFRRHKTPDWAHAYSDARSPWRSACRTVECLVGRPPAVCSTRFFVGSGGQRQCWPRNGLATGPSPVGRCPWHAPGGVAGLCEAAFLWRVCLRYGLG